MREVNGQVFVRLKAGETIKLSLVPIALIESNKLVAHIYQVRKDYDAETLEIERDLSNREKALSECTEAIAKLHAEQQVAIRPARNARDAIEEAERKLIMSWPYLSAAQRQERSDNLQKLKLQLEPQISNSAKLQTGIESLQSEENAMSESLKLLKPRRNRPPFKDLLVTSTWPQSSAATRSDAEGRFSFSANLQTNYFIIAETSREMLGEKEQFLWVVPLESGTMLLNNANMFDPR